MLRLHEVPFFSQFSFVELEAVGRAVELQEYAPGAVLCRKGESGRFLFAIASGSVKVLTKDDQGFFHGPGQLIGELSLLSGLPVSATIVATKPTKVYALGKETLQSLLDSKPSLYRTFTELLASRVRRHPLDRSPETPICVIVGFSGEVSECYALARTLFGRICKYAPGSVYCQLEHAEDSATSTAQLRDEPGVPQFLQPFGECYKIIDDALAGNFGVLLQRESFQPAKLMQGWRAYGAYGQSLVIALPWQEAKSLSPTLENRDAVIRFEPPGVGSERSSTPNDYSVGKADYVEVRLVAGNNTAEGWMGHAGVS